MENKNNRGGHNKRVDTVKITTTVEKKHRDNAKKNHGTYSNAIRFAAENKPEKNKNYDSQI